MDVAAIQELVRDLNFDTFGVEVTIEPAAIPLQDLTAFDEAALALNPNLYLAEAPDSGVTWSDRSGNDLDATLTGSPALGVDGVTFDGASEHASVSFNSLLEPGNTLTPLVLVKLSALPAADLLASLLCVNGTGGYQIFVDEDGFVGFARIGGSTIVLSTVPIEVGKWYLIAVSKSGSEDLHLYIGRSDRTGDVTDQTIAATGANLQIARQSASVNYAACTIARLGVYPEALSRDQILALWMAYLDAYGTTGIWMTQVTEGQPSSFRQGINRREAHKVLAIKKDDAAGLTRDGFRILAPDGPGGTSRVWRIDGPNEIFPDHTRFTLAREDSAGDS